MARDHAKFYISVWDDEDFKSLTAHHQWTYWSLCISPDLSYCGVLPNLPKRIAALAQDQTAAKVIAALKALATRNFIVLDDDTDEVLVRAHVRRDGILKQPNVIRAMNKAFDKVRSEAIREVIHAEVERTISELSEKAFTEKHKEAMRDGFGEDLVEPLAEPLYEGIEDPYDEGP